MTGFDPSAAEALRASPSRGLRGDIAVPGDKSISHRALILGALAAGETRINGLLEGADVMRTAEAVRALGAQVVRHGDGCWSVTGAEWKTPRRPIDCGNAGTAARLLIGAAAGFPITVAFTGDESLRARPMRRVLDPLRAMGAEVGATDRLPMTIRGGGLTGISYRSPHASAQVKSAILLAGLRAEGAVSVTEPMRSRDHIEHMLRAFGCDVMVEGLTVSLGSERRLRATRVAVPGDPSSAAFPLVAALIAAESEVTVRGVLISPLRAGLFGALREMGAALTITNRRTVGGEPIADVTTRSARLAGVEIAADRVPAMIDEIPILAMAAACAAGRTVIHGLGELRIKESDRLAAIVAGLRRCGVDAAAEGDTLIVHGCGGPPPGGARIASEGDHRIAMAFLVLGLGCREPVTVDGAAMIGTSFPGFAVLMAALGARIAADV